MTQTGSTTQMGWRARRSSESKSGQWPRRVGSGWVDKLDGHDRSVWVVRLIRLV